MVGHIEHGGDTGEGEAGGTGGDIPGMDELHGDRSFEHGVVSRPHLSSGRATEEFDKAVSAGDDRSGHAPAWVLQCHHH